jgi:hypothetical protein
VQVIPPLRALERPLSCRQCAQPLFAYASVLRLDLDPDLVTRTWVQGVPCVQGVQRVCVCVCASFEVGPFH